jgi:hypothetical protein
VWPTGAPRPAQVADLVKSRLTTCESQAGD